MYICINIGLLKFDFEKRLYTIPLCFYWACSIFMVTFINSANCKLFEKLSSFVHSGIVKFLMEAMRFFIPALNIKKCVLLYATRNFNFPLECEKDIVCIMTALVPPVHDVESILKVSFNSNYSVY